MRLFLFSILQNLQNLLLFLRRSQRQSQQKPPLFISLAQYVQKGTQAPCKNPEGVGHRAVGQ